MLNGSTTEPDLARTDVMLDAEWLPLSMQGELYSKGQTGEGDVSFFFFHVATLKQRADEETRCCLFSYPDYHSLRISTTVKFSG